MKERRGGKNAASLPLQDEEEILKGAFFTLSTAEMEIGSQNDLVAMFFRLLETDCMMQLMLYIYCIYIGIQKSKRITMSW